MALSLKGEAVMLGLDVDESFTSTAARTQALSGNLKYVILAGKVVSGELRKFYGTV